LLEINSTKYKKIKPNEYYHKPENTKAIDIIPNSEHSLKPNIGQGSQMLSKSSISKDISLEVSIVVFDSNLRLRLLRKSLKFNI